MAVANTYGDSGNTIGTLNGLFKEVYADKLKNAVPDQVKIMTAIKFTGKEAQLGGNFNQPVILQLEHGITFASTDQDAFTLAPAVAGAIRNAQIKGCPAVLRSVVGYAAASRSSHSASAFEEATKYLVANMMRSMAKKLEAEMLYGQQGYGTVNGALTTTSTAITVTTAEWAPGIFAGGEGMPIEVRSADGSTSRGTATITGVSFETRSLTLGSAIAGMVDGDVLWHGGAYGNEFIGVHAILTKTSGLLFNINCAQYNLFRGNQYAAGSSALSFSKLQQASARAVEKGLDGKLTVFCNPRAWANMLSDQAALRRYDGSYKTSSLENGATSLKFDSQNGVLEIVPSIFVKEGYAYMLAMDDWSRVGSSDMSFKRAGHEGDYFRDLDSAAGYELRLYTDQAIFCSAPAKSVIITGIVNQA